MTSSLTNVKKKEREEIGCCVVGRNAKKKKIIKKKKGAMDALLVDEGDVWNPNESCKLDIRKFFSSVSRFFFVKLYYNNTIVFIFVAPLARSHKSFFFFEDFLKNGHANKSCNITNALFDPSPSPPSFLFI